MPVDRAPFSMRTSVLINNYNNAPFLRACIDSVFAQTHPADEIIVCDDGSTDDSLAIIQEYKSRLTIISQPRGCSTPWANQGAVIHTSFRASTGDIIFLLDGDDLFSRHKIEHYLAAFAAAPRAVLVQGPLWKIDQHGRDLGLEYDPRRHARNYLQYIYATHEVNIFYPTSAQAFRRAYLEQRLPLDFSDQLPLWSDARLALVAPHFGEVITLEAPLTLWRRHPRSHTVAKPTAVFDQMQTNRQYYNAFCISRGLRPVVGWRSAQHYKRWLRRVCPPLLLGWYQSFPRRLALWGVPHRHGEKYARFAPKNAD